MTLGLRFFIMLETLIYVAVKTCVWLSQKWRLDVFLIQIGNFIHYFYHLKSLSEWLGKLKAVNLMCLLASINAAKNIPSITDYFQELVDEDKGMERCEIVSAVALTDEQRGRISKEISEFVGKVITVETRVDEKILGGFVARVGDKLIDGSLKTRFDDLKRELVRTT